MKFLFMYPPINNLELGPSKYFSIGAHVPPIGVLYLARILELNGYEVEVLDLNADTSNYEQIKGKIRSSDFVGLTLYSGPISVENTIKLSKLVKETDPDIPILIGGPQCSYFPERSLIEHQADVCVKGEAENVIIPVVEALQGKRKLSEIPGLYYKEGDSVKKTGEPVPIGDLDSIPFPDRHLVEKYDYGYMSGLKMSKGRTTSLISSRGCPHKCRFCGLNYIVPGYRRRSTENVIKEVDEIIDSGYKTLVFVDDNFLQNKKGAEKVMDFIISKNADVRIWIEQTRLDSADETLYKKMRDAGTDIVHFGIESGNQEILDYYNKKLTLDQIRYAVDLCKKMGFFVVGSFILGAPIETREQIENTKKFAKSLALDGTYFFNFIYMIGSPIWEECVKEGKLKPDVYFASIDKNKGLGNFTKEEILDIINRVYYSYYFDPRLWIRELIFAFRKKDFRFIRQGIKLLTSSKV